MSRPRSRSRPADSDRAAHAAARRAALADARRAAVPTITYPEHLPVVEHREAILQAIRDHQVVVLAGETGSGKSTQLPKLCLELGRGVEGMIGHTQPRRLAARAVAERVAEELGSEVGGAVGYAVRFTDRVSEQTLVKVMTDGILLAEIQRDRELRAYDTILIDEAHERSLNIDFLIGYLHQLLPRRPDLKVVITSATIDTARFAEHFGGAPVIEVSGRTYPVEVRYRPFGEEPDDDRDQTQAVCDAVEELSQAGPGDVLVFLSGEREIHDTADALRRMAMRDTEVMALYARLSSQEQHRVFAAHTGRRIVLATNVAETSLTVPGIRYVVDAGTARISRYSRRLKVQRLPIEDVSQASANQRAGRCGRVGPGICIRLYSEESFTSRPEFTEPEILRTNLASVILQMTAIGLGDVGAFPFVDPPDARSVRDAVAVLDELDALDPGLDRDGQRRLTRTGRRLARLPVDPRLGRMVLEADRLGCVREVLVLAAALSIQDPRERPADAQQAADELHRRFTVDTDSDFVAVLRLWDHLRERQQELSSTQFRKLCRAEHLSYLRVREWQDLFSQLRRVAGDLGIHLGTDHAHPDLVHQALLSGLLANVGMRDERTGEYRGARGARFAIAPGSVLTRRTPRWVMVAELVETNRLWGRRAAVIQPQWIEKVGGHLVQRTYLEPRWDEQRGQPVVTEKVTLHGLPVVAGRAIALERVDRALARELFVRHALVNGEWDARHPFVDHNRRVIDAVRDLEARARRHDLLARDEAIAARYLERIGPDVTSRRHFDAWYRRAAERDPAVMDLTLAELLDDDAAEVRVEDFPDRLAVGDVEVDLVYVFDPGADDDGVTALVPLAQVERVDPTPATWQVPGHRLELVSALIRALPKAVRRTLVPASERAAEVLAAHGPGDGPLEEVLCAHLAKIAGQAITPRDLERDRIPPELVMRWEIVGLDGTRLAAGRDFREVRAQVRRAARALAGRVAPDIERDGLTTWPETDLPRVVTGHLRGMEVVGYPAFVIDGDHVAIRTMATRAEQAAAMGPATQRFTVASVPSAARDVARALGRDATLALAGSRRVAATAVIRNALAAAADELIEREGGPPFEVAGFESLRRAARGQLVPTATVAATAAAKVVALATQVDAALDRLTADLVRESAADIERQLMRLVTPTMVTTAGIARLPDLQRYLQAALRRVDALASDPGKDRLRMQRIVALESAYHDAVLALPRGVWPPEAERGMWMLEELRVSVFAQALGTNGPVSEQRIAREIAGLRLAAR